MLGLDNPIHIAFLLVLLLLVFGAKRLPEMGRSLGEGLRGFRESISGEAPTAHLSDTHAHDAARVGELSRVDELPVTHPSLRHATEERAAERTPIQPAG
jgi:sec-independent protein translocase protein TatA